MSARLTGRAARYASAPHASRRLLPSLNPGDRIMVAVDAEGVATLPVYVAGLNAVATVLEAVVDDRTAVVPCLSLRTDLGVVRGSMMTHVTPT